VRAELRETRYDVALIASEEPEAYRLARVARIPVRVGFHNGWAKPFKSWWVRRQLTRALYRPASATRETLPEVETLFALGAGLHGERNPTHAVARLRPLVLDDGPAPDARVAIQISPKFAGAGLGERAFTKVVATLAARHPCFALAVEKDAAFARSVVAAAGIALETPADVRAWKARIAAARALVTPDSGAAHVAGMSGTPAVVLFGAGPSLARDVIRWRPWASPSRSLAIDPTCGETFAHRVDEALGSLIASAAEEG
jgi:ADP-heptose:LPS heptosyltransferase